MSLTTLLTEFYSYGFNYLDDSGAGATRATAFINSAYQELCNDSDWPFLEANATGTSTVTLTDLRKVESVVNTTTSDTLQQTDRRTLTNAYGVLTATGTPTFWYLTTGSVVKSYPVGGTLSVNYWKVPTDLSSGSDVPVVPSRYQDLIVLGAVRRALVDDQDGPDYQQVQAEYAQRLGSMRADLLLAPEAQAQTATHGDG